ncbi:MAG: hypothetical protein FOGNACKC_03613 [Anaerolineae bacterium]|nr:hypothetical protein [Anaerolineae bacterium]
MSKTRRQAVKRTDKQRGEKRIFSVTLLILLVVLLLTGFKLFTNATTPQPTPTPAPATTPEIRIPAPQVPLAPTVAALEARALPVNKQYSGLVGIVAGHHGYDPGAVCPDGLTEAEVNYNVAVEVTNLLQRLGVQTDLLDEFDPRLTGYQADALVSIHADSCSVPGATGFKAARVTNSAIPAAEDLLVDCINQEYTTYTGLPFHPGSITDDMTNYHAFNEIAQFTPGAIIETGFLLEDRYLLESKPKIVARGIAAGILCYLDQRAALPQ